jgi:hypothetical protein
VSLVESFTAGMGTILGVQVVPIVNITTLTVVDMHINQSNSGPERHGQVLLSVDGALYRLDFQFSEETYDQRTIEGFPKRRNPKAILK